MIKYISFILNKLNNKIDMKNKTESIKNTNLRIWIILFVGIILIFVNLAYPQICIRENNLSPLILAIGKSFLAASIIGLILRVPSLLNDVNNSSINLFKNNNFLKKLSVEELYSLRVAATESAYLKSANRVNSSLKEIDTRIANLFLQPYFSNYKIIVRCKLSKDKKFIEKTTTTTFTLNNPGKEKCNATEFIRSRVISKKNDTLKNEEIRRIIKLQTIIDEKSNWNNDIDKIKLLYENYFEESSPYNLLSDIQFNDNDKFKFENSIQFRVTEKRTVGIEDNTYIHRVISPVEKFSINYSFEESDVDLIGNCFGTFQDTKNGGIDIVKDKNSINISSSKWLLNGNGIIIVHNFNNK